MKKFAAAALALVALSAPAFAGDTPVRPGWFGYLEGAWLAKTGTSTQEFVGVGNYLPASTGEAWDGGGKLGYRFGDMWDIALGGRYFRQDTGKQAPDQYGWRFQDGKYWNADLELGQTTIENGGMLRIFVGARYQKYEANFHDSFGGPIFATDVTSDGIGPRVGIEVRKPVCANVSAFGAIDGAALFGTIKDSKNANWNPSLNGHFNRTFYDGAARAGLDFAVTPLMHLAVGFKAEVLNGINYGTPGDSSNGGFPSGRGGELIYGPFARLSVNY